MQCPPLDSAAEYGQRSAAFRLNKTLASNLRLNDASLSLALCALHSPDLAAGEQGIRFSLLACSAALYVRRRERQNVVSRKRVHRRSLSRMFQFDDQHMLQSALDLISLLSIFPCSVIGFTIVSSTDLSSLQPTFSIQSSSCSVLQDGAFIQFIQPCTMHTARRRIAHRFIVQPKLATAAHRARALSCEYTRVAPRGL